MLRVMYDSDNLDDIPAEAEIVAFYDDGEPGTPTPEQLSKHAGKVLVSITRKVGVKAKVADIEPGCIWPPSNAIGHFHNGLSDTVYCSLGNLPRVHGVLDPLFPGLSYWVAEWDGDSSALPTVEGVNIVAKQFVSPSYMTVPGHYDVSIVSDNWPVPNPNPTTKKETPVSDVPTHPEDVPVRDADNDLTLAAPIVDAVSVAGGLYMVAADGGVFVQDAAVFHGSVPALKDAQGQPIKLNASIVSILVDDHSGYTLVGGDGGMFRFGNGPEYRSL